MTYHSRSDPEKFFMRLEFLLDQPAELTSAMVKTGRVKETHGHMLTADTTQHISIAL